MSGSGSTKRSQNEAMRAARMARDGLTNREISASLNINVKIVPNRIQLGERLLSIEKQS